MMTQTSKPDIRSSGVTGKKDKRKKANVGASLRLRQGYDAHVPSPARRLVGKFHSQTVDPASREQFLQFVIPTVAEGSPLFDEVAAWHSAGQAH